MNLFSQQDLERSSAVLTPYQQTAEWCLYDLSDSVFKGDFDQDWAILSPTEQLTLQSLSDKTRFFRAVHRKAMIRRILAGYGEILAKNIEFRASEKGKPFISLLSWPKESRIPHFSLSHSADLAILAVSFAEIGLDVEKKRYVSPRLLRKCSPQEQLWLADLSEDVFSDAFLHCWTRKEAVIKALGSSLSLWLRRLAVPEGHAQLPTGENGQEERWVTEHPSSPSWCSEAIVACAYREG